jgi:hypothetical protein
MPDKFGGSIPGMNGGPRFLEVLARLGLVADVHRDPDHDGAWLYTFTPAFALWQKSGHSISEVPGYDAALRAVFGDDLV